MSAATDDQDDLSEEEQSDSDSGGHEAEGESSVSVTAACSKQLPTSASVGQTGMNPMLICLLCLYCSVNTVVMLLDFVFKFTV